MNKTYVLLAGLVLFSLSSGNIKALEIMTDNYGKTLIYFDSVLGEDSDGMEKEYEAEKKLESNERMRFSSEKDEIKVKYEKVDQDRRPVEKQEIREESSTRLRLNTPAKVTPAQEQKTERMEAALKAERQKKIEESSREEIKVRKEEDNEYLEKLRQERRERENEKIEIRNQEKSENQELEFASRGVVAKLKENGAQFAFDPATNQVTVITPSGNEHVLYHLPDQALERIKEAQVIDEISLDSDLEITTDQSGKTYFKAQVAQTKRLMGIFPRTIRSEIVMDDETGQVNQEPVQSNILTKFLDNLSF